MNLRRLGLAFPTSDGSQRGEHEIAVGYICVRSAGYRRRSVRHLGLQLPQHNGHYVVHCLRALGRVSGQQHGRCLHDDPPESEPSPTGSTGGCRRRMLKFNSIGALDGV
jgi:hypothetical protein